MPYDMRISDWSSDVCSSDLPAAADYRPTDPQVAFHLGRFIEQVRSIPADPIIVRPTWLRAYDFTTTRGAVALNDYARANDPLSRLDPVQISFAVSSALRPSPRNYRGAWPDSSYPAGRLKQKS